MTGDDFKGRISEINPPLALRLPPLTLCFQNIILEIYLVLLYPSSRSTLHCAPLRYARRILLQIRELIRDNGGRILDKYGQ